MATHFYGIDLGGATSVAARTGDIERVWRFLKPTPSARPLTRLGADVDGSYLVPDDLDGITACFSPGANRIKHFEDVLTDSYGIQAHMCDFSCEAEDFVTPLRPRMQTFAKKWLDAEPGEDNISLEDWVREHDVPGDLLLQIDIEGAEYRNLLAASDETLGRFRIVVMEVHGLGKLLDQAVLDVVLAPFFDKLARQFTTVHAHPNNCCGEVQVPGSDIRIPNVLELTLVRNDHFVPGTGPVLLPHPLDVSRNVPRRPPLFLSDAWCDHARPLESRVKMLEDSSSYRDEMDAAGDDGAGALTLTMRSLQTVMDTPRSPLPATGTATEVARGRPYRLSSSYGDASRDGVVHPAGDYFFHTGFGRDQWIRVDLGRTRTVRRVEVTNRTSGHQDRARVLFVVASQKAPPGAGAAVYPMVKQGRLPAGAWRDCRLDLPGVRARFLTIVSPIDTALHFADLRIFADDDAAGSRPALPGSGAVPGRARRAARTVLRRLRRRAARRATG